MALKRKPEDVLDAGDWLSPTERAKKDRQLKIYVCDKLVEIGELKSFDVMGVNAEQQILSPKDGSPKWTFQAIRDHIQTYSILRCQEEDEEWLLYSGFKGALTALVDDIEVATKHPNECKVILIHGIPKVGKSTLAKCLAFYLARTGQKTICTHLRHELVDKDDVTNLVIRQCKKAEWIVLDQCNVNMIDFCNFSTYIRTRLCKNPIVMFTSGLFTPTDEWTVTGEGSFISYKVINMKVNSEAVDVMKERTGKIELKLSNEDLLDITRNFGHMQDCINLHIIYADIEKQELEDRIYPVENLHFLQESAYVHIVYLTWPKYSERVPDDQTLQKEIDNKLKASTVEYLAYIGSRNKDHFYVGLHNILNLLDLDGDEKVNTDGYCEYKTDAYWYFFPCMKPVYRLLRDVWDDYDRYEAYNDCLSAFKMLKKRIDSTYSYTQDGLFEMLVQLSCEIRKGPAESIQKTGVKKEVESAVTTFVHVHFSESAGTIDELFDLMNNKVQAISDISVWCRLNEVKKVQFKGYDFVYFVVQEKKISQCQLFQVSINPQGKTAEQKANIVDVLEEIKDRLTTADLVDDPNVVKPFFHTTI